nr:PREDICTED: uncharacterized protein LOC109039754 isoform X1 [Bemisia tabaci]
MGRSKSTLDIKRRRDKKRNFFCKNHHQTYVQCPGAQLNLQRNVPQLSSQQHVLLSSDVNADEVTHNESVFENQENRTSSSLEEATSSVDPKSFQSEELGFQILESLVVDGKSLEELLEESPLSDDDSDYDNECTSSKFEEEEKFKSNLRDWHKKYAVTNVALCGLLLILRGHPCFSYLPKSDKTFLQTPRKLDYEEMDSGLYHHIGLESTLRRVLAAIKEKVSTFRLVVGIDEIPIFKSVPSGMIPIMISFLDIESLKKVVLPVGIYYGPKKAAVSKFLKRFVEEATKLIKNGLIVGSSQIKIIIEGFICDTPGKAYIMNTKGHRGYRSCTKCKADGQDYMNRMTFPSNKKIKLRTHEEFVKMDDEDYQLGETPLMELPDIDFINSFPLDVMHIVFLGIVRSLTYIWIFAKQPKKLPFRIIDGISKNLVFLSSYMPCEFNRKGRSMNEIRRWKATEFRTLLLYTGIIALKELENDYPQIYFNFLMLHVIMRILLSPEYARRYSKYAESLIEEFSKDSERLYGLEFLTSNMHNLRHLPLNLNRFTTMDECSAFKIENALYSLKKLTRKPAKPLHQTCSRLEEFTRSGQWFHNAPTNHSPFSFEAIREHSSGPTLPDCNGMQFKVLKLPNFKIGIDSPDYSFSLIDGSVIIVRNIVIPLLSQDQPIIIGQKFNSYENFFPEPLCSSSLLGIHVLDELEPTLTSWPLTDISEKVVLLPFQNKNVCIPLLEFDA